ncbi:hypothetical protein CHS0354_040582 [Potamilus streckersoni]|uniref:Uncharacterized protein n=1 Tax=Potamilus streckersoni TaxID=2493646 RepID=A0AAE0SGT7_9BIVA|nr:hypothetical protein CHS0354_040582 [Potamilus streckersoni]
MAEGGEDYAVPNEQIRNIRKLQELCKGRLTEIEVRKIMELHDWDLNRTANAILCSNPEDLRDILGRTDEDELQAVFKDDVIQDLLRKQDILSEVRQFACKPCDNVWWRKVPARKMVSTCRICRIKYDAIPKEEEWGWAIFECSCGNIFSGFGQMNVTKRTCYRNKGGCGQFVLPSQIRPPDRRCRKKMSPIDHSFNVPYYPGHFPLNLSPGLHIDCVFFDPYHQAQKLKMERQADDNNADRQSQKVDQVNQQERPVQGE